MDTALRTAVAPLIVEPGVRLVVRDSLRIPPPGILDAYHRDDRPSSPRGPGAPRPPVARPTESSVTESDAAKAARRAEETALLSRVVDRDETAVEELYRRYAGPLYSLAYQVTGADRFAQDVVQETFVALWKDASRFDSSKGAVGPWLFSLARHKAIDLVRKEANVRKRTADVDLELEVAPDDVDRMAWLKMRQERVREAIGQLTPAQRESLLLAFFQGLTHVEVAERLGIPLGTAKTRIRSGLLRMRELLGDSLADEEEPTTASAARG